MAELAFRFGYVGLFVATFLSATLVPLASEFVVIAMPRLGYNLWLTLLLATAGNILGSVVNYYVGLWGADFTLSRYFEMKPEMWARAERLFRRYGAAALFFSWVPIVGDPLTTVAGAFRVRFGLFLFWVAFGKTLRYILLLGIAQQAFNYLGG